MPSAILVLDANIIIRAVLGERVKKFLINNIEAVDFFTPDTCIKEVEKYLPILFEKRSLSSDLALDIFSKVKPLLQVVDKSIYYERAADAQQRIKDRDFFDWPAVATALIFNCPIWTEDKDFFGVGIPTWTTDRVHVFFQSIKN